MRRTLRQVKWGEQFPMDSYAALCSQVLCCDNVQSRAVLLSREIFYSVVTTAGGHRRKQRWKGNYSILRGRCTPIVPLCLQLESLPVPPIVPTVTGHLGVVLVPAVRFCWSCFREFLSVVSKSLFMRGRCLRSVGDVVGLFHCGIKKQ